MTEHLSAEQRERYRQRILSPAELLAVDDHIAACEPCRQSLAEGEAFPAALASLAAELRAAAAEEPEHLSYDLLAAYVDGTLDAVDREIAEGHLEGCPRCVSEARDLRAFRAALTTFPARTYAPARPRTLAERLRAWWRSPSHGMLLPAAGAAAAAGLVVWAATLSLRAQLGELRTEVGQLQQRNAALAQQVARAVALPAQVAQLQQESRALREESQAARGTIAGLRAQVAQLQRPEARPSPGGPHPTLDAASSAPLLVLNDGGRRVTLDRLGNLKGLGPLPTAVAHRLETALARGQVPSPAGLDELVGKAGTLMGPAEEGVPFALLAPVGTAVESAQPTFRWRALPGAEQYRVTVSGEDWLVIAQSERIAGTQWTIPTALGRGQLYQWQVTALKEGQEIVSPQPPAPEARFRVIDAAQAAELTRARQRYRGSHLVLGLLYAQVGLLDAAERELQALTRDNPNSAAARRLLQSLRSRRSATAPPKTSRPWSSRPVACQDSGQVRSG